MKREGQEMREGKGEKENEKESLAHSPDVQHDWAEPTLGVKNPTQVFHVGVRDLLT